MAAYGLLGILGVALLTMLALVLTSNRINDRKSSIAAFERDAAAARAAADTLRPYGRFAQLQQARVETVNSLVDSAFNWERVLRQLSRTIPSDVWLTSFTGTVAPGTKLESGEGGGSTTALRNVASHPAVVLGGCTYSHRSVARMMTRMRNLDDVTDVVLGSSERAEGSQAAQAGAAGAAEGGGTGSECRTTARITKFDILVVLGESQIGPPAPAATAAASGPAASAQAAVATASQPSASGVGP
jgi:Tfp pilus assembly protein PilN